MLLGMVDLLNFMLGRLCGMVYDKATRVMES